MITVDNLQWAYAATEYAENWYGPYKSKAEAIEGGMDMLDSHGGSFYISKCRNVKDTDEDIQKGWTFIVYGEVENVILSNRI